MTPDYEDDDENLESLEYSSEHFDYLVQCVNADAALIEELAGALRSVEWSGWDSYQGGVLACPSCKAWSMKDEHNPNCPLAAALAKVRPEPKP